MHAAAVRLKAVKSWLVFMVGGGVEAFSAN